MRVAHAPAHAATCAACRMCPRVAHMSHVAAHVACGVARAGTSHMRVPHPALAFTSNFTFSCNSTGAKKNSLMQNEHLELP
jgi:hypothetical protein